MSPRCTSQIDAEATNQCPVSSSLHRRLPGSVGEAEIPGIRTFNISQSQDYRHRTIFRMSPELPRTDRRREWCHRPHAASDAAARSKARPAGEAVWRGYASVDEPAPEPTCWCDCDRGPWTGGRRIDSHRMLAPPHHVRSGSARPAGVGRAGAVHGNRAPSADWNCRFWRIAVAVQLVNSFDEELLARSACRQGVAAQHGVEIVGLEELLAVLTSFRFIVLEPNTRNLIMKERADEAGAYLINTARGGLSTSKRCRLPGRRIAARRRRVAQDRRSAASARTI